MILADWKSEFRFHSFFRGRGEALSTYLIALEQQKLVAQLHLIEYIGGGSIV